jgi:hypothetical protein
VGNSAPCAEFSKRGGKVENSGTVFHAFHGAAVSIAYGRKAVISLGQLKKHHPYSSSNEFLAVGA